MSAPAAVPVARRRTGWRGPAAVLLDLLLPVALYYVLRRLGAEQLPALVAGSLLSVASLAVRTLVQRRVDGVAWVLTGLALVGIAASLVSGSPRALLVRDGVLTGAGGLWFLATLRYGSRPLAYTFTRPLLERLVRTDESWDSLWERSARFRRIWELLTAIWAAALIGDAVVRVVLALVLPVDVVPLVTTLQYVALVLALQVVAHVLFWRLGLWRLLGRRWGRP